MVCKAENIYYLILCRKNLPACSKQPQGANAITVNSILHMKKNVDETKGLREPICFLKDTELFGEAKLKSKCFSSIQEFIFKRWKHREGLAPKSDSLRRAFRSSDLVLEKNNKFMLFKTWWTVKISQSIDIENQP